MHRPDWDDEEMRALVDLGLAVLAVIVLMALMGIAVVMLG